MRKALSILTISWGTIILFLFIGGWEPGLEIVVTSIGLGLGAGLRVWAYYLWAHTFNHHWAFMFLALIPPLGALGVVILAYKSKKKGG